MNIAAIEAELLRLQIFWAAISVLGLMFSMWILYLVVKAAIRDGIKESGLVETWQSRVTDRLAKDDPLDVGATR